MKGRASNTIAWIFIVLQFLMLLGGVLNIMYNEKPFWSSLTKNSIAIVSLIGKGNVNFLPELTLELVFLNVLGFGAFFLSSFVLLRYRNETAKITVITALIVIGINSLLYIGDMA